MESEIQKFLSEEILRHARVRGFAFLLEEDNLLLSVMERFNMTRSEAVWEMTVFIQDNGGPEGDLAVIDGDGKRFFQWRFVEWPSWMPRYVKKPRWHKPPLEERHSAHDF